MTREEYEQHRRSLDEQLRIGVELLQAAHATQVRALEVVWVGSSGGARAAEEPVERGPADPQKAPRRRAYALEDEVWAALAQLPEVFNPRDVCRALDYEPHRASLHRVLERLVIEKQIAIQTRGEGRTPTEYRKVARG